MSLSSIRVMGQKIRIVRTPNLPDNQAVGMANEAEGVITLWSGLAKDIERQTIAHEILHIIGSMMGLKCLNGSAASEANVSVIANCLLQVLRDNPALVKELTEK